MVLGISDNSTDTDVNSNSTCRNITRFTEVTNTTTDTAGSSFDYRALLGNINLVLLILGCFGNCLTIIVLRTIHRSYSSTAMYFSALAASDIIILLSSGLHCYLLQYWKINLRTMSIFSCKVNYFLVYASTETSSCLLVAVTVERVISVMFPLKVKTTCSSTVAKIVIFTLWVIIYGINLHFFFSLSDRNPECGLEQNAYMHLINIIVSWVDLVVTFVVPYIVILFGNILIISKLTKNHARLTINNTERRYDTSLTVTLVCVNIAFVVTVSPLLIVTVIFPISISCDQIEDSDFSFWNAITITMSNLNAVINFYLYLMSGSQFREDFKLVVTSWLCCLRTNSVGTSRINRSRTSTSEASGF